MSSPTEVLRERICWTRMQAESGEALARIVRRKEIERRAGGGCFFWGIGNAPSRTIPALVRAGATIEVVFSVMKSRPKAHDLAPNKVVCWQAYVNPYGVVRPLPAHALVTSRASTRACHYALVCRSDAPLEVADAGPFDPSAFRNCGAGGAVGASQVTALIERFAPDGQTEYRIAMRAWLTGGLWVKLVDPVELSVSTCAAIGRVTDDQGDWLDLIEMVRSSDRRATAREPVQPSLFAV